MRPALKKLWRRVKSVAASPFVALGRASLSLFEVLGGITIFTKDAFAGIVRHPPRIGRVFDSMYFIGVQSLGVAILVGGTIGAILAVESYDGLHKFGAERFVGSIVFLSMTKQFGPVVTAIMVIGRAISAVTAEIGTMKITEQIDALRTLSIDVHSYITLPRIIGSTIMMPFVSLFATLSGTLLGYLVSVHALKISPDQYYESIRQYSEMKDIVEGLVKAVFFGFLIAVIGCYKGFNTRGGARGVGIATTESVVYANIAVFISDYILSSFITLF